MKYCASLGGHSPGYLRDAFLYWLEANEERDFVIVGWNEEKKPIRWLIGQLWNCTDIMPSGSLVEQ